MLPLTLDADTAVVPAGSCPLAARASHSQPTSAAPMLIVAPAVCVAAVVKRHTRSLPWAALTRSGNAAPALSPMYWPPASEFSGRLGPLGSRHVEVGEPLGSVTCVWIVL